MNTVNPKEAPPGYTAHLYRSHNSRHDCRACVFVGTLSGCRKPPDFGGCGSTRRKDGCSVYFTKDQLPPTSKTFDPNYSAPEGYIAILDGDHQTGGHGCTGCAFAFDKDPELCPGRKCTSVNRPDGCNVTFIKKPTTKEEDQTMTPYEQLSRTLDLKVGDFVKIVSKCPDNHLGWTNGWTSDMTASVEAAFKVMEVSHTRGVQSATDRWWYPVHCLEKQDPPALPKLQGVVQPQIVDGDLKMGCQTYDTSDIESFEYAMDELKNLGIIIPTIQPHEELNAMPMADFITWLATVKPHMSK